MMFLLCICENEYFASSNKLYLIKLYLFKLHLTYTNYDFTYLNGTTVFWLYLFLLLAFCTKFTK